MSEETDKPQARANALVERLKAILLKPRETWPVIAAEATEPVELIRSWIVPLALIGPVAMFIGLQAFGIYGFRPSLGYTVGTAIGQFVGAVISTIVLSLVADLLAPRFGGHSDRKAAFKLVSYSASAFLVAGVVMLVPALSPLGLLGFYALYLFYLGAPVLLGIPDDEQAIIFTLVTFLVGAIVLWVVNTVSASFVGPLAGPTNSVGMIG